MIKFGLSCLLAVCMTFSSWGQGYNINVELDNYSNDTCILGFRMGDKNYVKDTAFTTGGNGQFTFKGEELLDPGVYLILTKPGNRMFEFLVVDQEEQKNLEIKNTWKPAGVLNEFLKVKNSPDNQALIDYSSYVRSMLAKNKELTTAMNGAKSLDDQERMIEIHREQEQLSKDVLQKQKDIIAANPSFLSSKIIAATIDVQVPKELQKDRKQAYYYYKRHYWDNFDWSDDRMIRSQFLERKVNDYLDRLTVKTRDSMIVSVDLMLDNILKTKNEKMFEYVASLLFNRFAKVKLLCIDDALYVHMGEKYYCSGLTHWVDAEQKAKICSDVAKLKPMRCGESAPNIALKNMKGEKVNLYDVKTPFVAVYFWDPGCGNCTKATKKLVPVYNKYKEKGFEIFGVCSKQWKDIEECRKKVKEQKMDWINTSGDAYPLGMTKKRYDLRANPYIVLLDKDKRIMWRRLDPEQLDSILEREFKALEKEKSATK